MFCTRDIHKCICTVTEVISACFFSAYLCCRYRAIIHQFILYVVLALSVFTFFEFRGRWKNVKSPNSFILFFFSTQHAKKSSHNVFFFCLNSYRQCMHITERLLNICYFLEKNEKQTKKVQNTKKKIF